jgi:hypothetical protein
MFLTKGKTAAALRAAVGLLAAGAGLFAQQALPSGRAQAEGNHPPEPPALGTQRPAPQDKKPLSAGKLVREMRQSQDWIHHVRSVSIRLEGKRSDPGKNKELAESVEITFDGRRLRREFTWEGLQEDLRVWDGTWATIYVRVPGSGPGTALLSLSPYDIGDDFLDNTHYRLSGLPFAVLVDAAGKVAAHGDPLEMFKKGVELSQKTPDANRK